MPIKDSNRMILNWVETEWELEAKLNLALKSLGITASVIALDNKTSEIVFSETEYSEIGDGG